MALPTIDVNYLSVLIAAIASFVLGWIWHGPIFGKAWMKETKFSESDKKKMKDKGMGGALVMNFIGNLITAYVLVHFIKFLGLATFTEAAQLAFWTWLGFFAAATLLNGALWEGNSWKMFCIKAGYWIINLIVIAGILTKWQ
mgnify:CR=1 FL=1